METNYKEATFRVYRNGLIERKNKRTDEWKEILILKDKYGDSVTRVDYKYVKVYRIMAVYFGLKIDDRLSEILHKDNNKQNNAIENLYIKGP